MFENQPKGLYALALANTGERFGYYTMLAIFALFMQAKFGWSEAQAGQIYAIFLAVVYFAPLFGGMLALQRCNCYSILKSSRALSHHKYFRDHNNIDPQARNAPLYAH